MFSYDLRQVSKLLFTLQTWLYKSKLRKFKGRNFHYIFHLMKISKFLSLFFCSGAISVSHLAIARGWIDRQKVTVKTQKSRFGLFSAETKIPRSQIKMTLFSNLRRNLKRFKRQRTPRN